MSNQFKDKLKEIRDASTRRSEAVSKERSADEIHRSQKTVMAFDYRERVERVIDELVAGFLVEAPSFTLSRGFFEGKYMLALRLDERLMDQQGEVDNYYSRIMFLLAPHSEDDSFGIQCRKTIRNKDLETHSSACPMTDQALPDLAGFIEEHFLIFARGYFGETPLSRPAGVPAPS